MKKKLLYLSIFLSFLFCSCQQNTQTIPLFNNPTTLVYEVHFHPNGTIGDEIIQKMNLGIAENLESLQYTAPVGLRFSGWNTKPDGSGEFYDDCQKFVIGAKNVNLYAIWIEKDAHAIHYYNVNGAENTNPLSFLESRTINLVNPGERTGYTFDGWYFNPSFTGSKVTGWNPGSNENDISLYAKWTPIIYTITYNLNEGTLENSNPASYTIETDTIILNNPTKTGHTFDGWYNGTTKITSIPKGSAGSITLTAKFTIITYTVNFYNDDGSLLLKQLKVDYGTPLTLERSYYNVSSRQLVRWNSNTNGKGTGYLFDSSISSCAQDYTFYSYSTDNLEAIVSSAANLNNTLADLQVGQTYYIIVADAIPDQPTIGSALSANSGVNVNLDLSFTNMTSISNTLCNGCTNVIDLKLPSTITYSSSDAFKNCTNLQDIYFEGTLNQWLNIYFYNNYSTPMVYGKRLFINGSEVSGSLTIPSGITSIKNYAFSGVNNITSLTIPEGVTSIGQSAFSSCYITSLSLPQNSLKTIGSNAFAYNKLTSLVVPDSVTSLGSGFINNSTIKTLTLPAGVTVLTFGLFYNVALTTITVPDTVTQFAGNAFQYCSKLTSLTFEGPNNWYISTPEDTNHYKNGQSINLSKPSENARLVKADGYDYNADGTIKGLHFDANSDHLTDSRIKICRD